MKRVKIVFVGGGSKAWMPGIGRDIMLTPSLCNAELVLYDIDKEASDLVKAFLEKLAGEIGAKPKIISTNNRVRAFRDADYVSITISTGWLTAMAHDLAIPEDYGIYHTVGDTIGPGGWARAIRNFDAFVDIANAINRYAPGAMVLNYTNPMAALTDVLSRLYDGPVVGLCHGLFENLEFIQNRYKLKSENEISVKYGGINHFFFITEAKAGKVDVIADLRKSLKKKSFTDLMKLAHKDRMGDWASTHREIATELFRQTGYMPYIGDRHTCENYSCYITNKANLKKYKVLRTPIRERRGFAQKAHRDLKRMIKGKIDKEYLTRTRETAADIIDAHFCGNVFIDVGNLPNTGQITNLPPGSIVETAVVVDSNGFSPIHFGSLPDQIAAMVAPCARVQKMTVDACFSKDKKMALEALRLDPSCAHLNAEQVTAMGQKLLSAHKKFITAF